MSWLGVQHYEPQFSKKLSTSSSLQARIAPCRMLVRNNGTIPLPLLPGHFYMVLASPLATRLQPFSMQPTFTTPVFTQLQKITPFESWFSKHPVSGTLEFLVHKSVSRKVASIMLSWVPIILTVSLSGIQPQIRTYGILT